MNKRGVGAIFCIIASVLYITKYIAAAIYLSNSQSWSEDLFYDGVSYIGNSIQYLSIISAIVGIGYLVIAEIEDFNKKNKSK